MSSAWATDVTGTIKKPDGTLINGTIEFALSQPARTTTPPVIYAAGRTTCAVTSGLIASGCTVVGNDTLDPAGTFYRIRVLDINNVVVVPSTNYTLTGASVDLGALPVTATDTLVPPTGSVTGNMNVTGNLTVGGSVALGSLLDLNRTVTAAQPAFGLVHNLKLTMDADAGGDYSVASKVSYEPLRIDLDGRTKGQQIALGVTVNAYGIGDALMIGGDIFGYGGKFVSGTSQPTVEFAEINVRQGNKVFTAQISGDPAASATTLNYTAEANEDVLGERLLLNTSRTTSTGTVTGIANDVVTFSGAPDWTTFSPSPVGQYFKINSEDVTLTGVSTGHWYRVTAVTSATQLQLETTYSGELASTGAYTLAEGVEIVGFDSAANTLTIESNSYDWAAADALASPPGHLINFRGLSLVLSKEFKTGTARVLHASNTLGPFRWEKGILLEGNSSGAGGFTTGIDFLNINADVGLSLEKSTYTEAAIKLAASQPIRWSTDADLTFDGTRFDFSRSGNFTSASAGVVPLLARHAASPTVSYFSLERDDGALIFGVDQNGMVRMKPAFGTGLEIDPDSVPTLRVVGGNTNTALRLDSKGTQAVAVNANANSGTGGFEVYSGGATPALRLRLHADADQITFGSAADTNLYRSAADTLKTDDSFVVAGTLTIGSVTISTGTGAPSGGCTTGSLFLRTDGGSSTTLYVCESSAWSAK